MDILFFKVLNMSLTASVICIVILILRSALRNKLPRWAFYAVWAIVLVRLLIPFAIPSRISVFNAVAPVQPVTESAAPIAFVQDSGAAVTLPAFPVSDPLAQSASNDKPLLPEPDLQPVPERAPVNISTILASIWICGVCALTVYSLCCYIYTIYRLRSARKASPSEITHSLFAQIGVSEKQVRIYHSDMYDSPVICGILFPKLVLTEHITDSDIAHVVAHELTHVKRHDNFWKLIATIALYLHWFNPLIWHAYHLYVTDMEASCDEAVIGRLGYERRSYAQSLLHMAVRNQSAFAGGFLAFGECALKERVKSVMNVKKYAVIITIVCISMIAGLALIFLTNPQKEAAISASQLAAELELLGISKKDTILISAKRPGGQPQMLSKNESSHVLKTIEQLRCLSGENPPVDGWEPENTYQFSFQDAGATVPMLTLDLQINPDGNAWIRVTKLYTTDETFYYLDGKAVQPLQLICGEPVQLIADPAPTPFEKFSSLDIASVSHVQIDESTVAGDTLPAFVDALNALSLESAEPQAFVGQPDTSIWVWLNESGFKMELKDDLVILSDSQMVQTFTARADAMVPLKELVDQTRQTGTPAQIPPSNVFEAPPAQNVSVDSDATPEDSTEDPADTAEDAPDSSTAQTAPSASADGVVPIWTKNPEAFQVDADKIDTIRITDLETSITTTFSDKETRQQMANYINSYKASPASGSSGQTAYKQLEITYRSGKTTSYNCYDSSIVVDGKRYQANSELRSLYIYLDRLQTQSADTLDVRTLANINEYTVTSMDLYHIATSRKATYLYNVSDIQRDAILEMTQLLKAVSVDSAKQIPVNDIKLANAAKIVLTTQNNAAQLIINLYSDGTFTVHNAGAKTAVSYRASDKTAITAIIDLVENYTK